MKVYLQLLSRIEQIRLRIFLRRIDKLLLKNRGKLAMWEDMKLFLSNPMELAKCKDEISRLIMIITHLEGLKKDLI